MLQLGGITNDILKLSVRLASEFDWRVIDYTYIFPNHITVLFCYQYEYEWTGVGSIRGTICCSYNTNLTKSSAFESMF